jgi:RimJ/RimL family protein N-acetyltransferase
MDRLKAPEQLETARLRLRRPTAADATAIFERYAADPEVTRYLSWPLHRTVADTHAFLAFSDEEWLQRPAGPYLVFERERHVLLGGTGLAFEAPDCAATGYVLARDAWGLGYATEALGAMVDLAPRVGLRRLYAICHAGHRASARVLEKCGFVLEASLAAHTEFPNLGVAGASDVAVYSRSWGPGVVGSWGPGVLRSRGLAEGQAAGWRAASEGRGWPRATEP